MYKYPCPSGCPGWVTFGSHVDSVYTGKLFFMGDDGAGMPTKEKHAEKWSSDEDT